MAKIKVITGAPCSGKTTYAKQHMRDNDILYDFDDLMMCLTGLPYQQTNLHVLGYVIDIRDLLISRLRTDANIDVAYIIVTTVSELLLSQLNNMDVDYITMDTTLEVCLTRLHDSTRTNKDNLSIAIVEWYTPKQNAKQVEQRTYKGKVVNPFYKTKRWLRVRSKVLRRDGYECRECKRYGKSTAATTAHHVNMLETHKHLALDANNLISLCNVCHGNMHNLKAYKLTDKGIEWVNRIGIS